MKSRRTPRLSKPSRIVMIVISIILITVLACIDARVPRLTFLMFYVMLVAGVAYYVGGTYAYFYAGTAAALRTIVQESFALNHDVLHVLWMYTNVSVANILVAWLIIKKDEFLQELQRSSLTDPLTQLPNRRAFNERLERAIAHSQRHSEPLSIAYIDVDRFKAVNDNYGHHRGDELLVLIGNTMKKDLRADDLPARLGGDEFAIIFTHKDGSDNFVRRLKRDLDTAVNDAKFDVSFSIGVVNYYGDREVNCEDLVRSADELMYEVKKSSKNAIRTKDFRRTHGIPT